MTSRWQRTVLAGPPGGLGGPPPADARQEGDGEEQWCRAGGGTREARRGRDHLRPGIILLTVAELSRTENQPGEGGGTGGGAGAGGGPGRGTGPGRGGLGPRGKAGRAPGGAPARAPARG